ncbi:MAG: nuclear transport factor 2 family protein [Hyphomonadaceae bacterium]
MPDTAQRPPDAATLFADVAAVASAYFDARASGDGARLDALATPIWHGKRVNATGDVVVEQRSALATPSELMQITAIAPCFDDFATVRGDNWNGCTTTFLLLFKAHGAWTVAGELSADVGARARDAHFAARAAEHEVLSVLHEYYRGVTHGDGAAMRRIFAPCWHMKNHEGEALVSEETEAFVQRLDGDYSTYWNDRQIADVHVAGDRIAYVRVNRPSTPSTTVFLFARTPPGWRITDKAWTDGRKPTA